MTRLPWAITTVTLWSIISAPAAATQSETLARVSFDDRRGVESLLTAPAMLDVRDVPLTVALNRLAEASGVVLAFSPSLMSRAWRAVSCECLRATVGEALDRILRGSRFTYAELRGQVMIYVEPRLQMETVTPVLSSVARLAPFGNGATGASWQRERPLPVLPQGTITGRVTNAQTGAPLNQVQVIVAGTTRRAFTNSEGQYVLTLVPDGSHSVSARLLGYRTVSQQVVVSSGQSVELHFALEPAPLVLDEVIVTVSATDARRVEIGTDFERFNAEAVLDRAVVSDFSDLLKSRMTGVEIVESSGEVGTASLIRVRGASSLTQDNNPIIYIDGIRVSNQTGTGVGALGSSSGDGQTISRLDDLNPQDIASVQVMKGPTAAALYGSEAAAGVILIETKRGVAGDPVFTLSFEQRFSRDITDYPDNYYNLTRNAGITDPDEPLIQQWRPVQNPVTGEIFARDNPLENPHTDPFRTGLASVVDLSLRGGQEALTYFSSLNYQNEDGVLPNNDLERFSVRANIHARPADKLDISVSTSFVRSDVRFNGTGRSPQSMITNALAGLPAFSFGTRSDGSRGDCLSTILFGTPESTCEIRQGNLRGSFEKIETVRNEQEVGRFIGSVTAHYRPTSWLANRLVVGLDHIQTSNFNLIPLDPDLPFRSLSLGTVRDERLTNQILTAEYAATITLPLGSRVESATTGGVQYFGSKQEGVACAGEGGFASTTAIACDAALTFTGSSDVTELVEVGAFFQQQFSFNRYLFITGAVRIDDNSAFGEDQDAIWSPSANLSAVISEMPFWNVDLVNSFRLRFAWGKAAQAPAPFAAATTFRPVRLDVGGTQVTGITPLNPGNPELTAERNEEFEVGLDAALLDNRVSLSFTYFNQETKDAIVGTRVSPGTGFSGTKFVNIGAIENKGIEATLNARVVETPDFTWDIDFKVSTSDPIVTSLGGEAPILRGAQVNGMFHEGHEPGAYYGPVVVSAERDASGNIIPGSIVFAEGNLNVPGQPTYRYLGDPTPDDEESLSLDFRLFRRLRVSTVFQRAGNFQKMDDTEGTRTPFIQNVSGSRQFALRQAESTPEEQAAMELDLEDAGQVFISDAGYVKWREVTVNYDLPPTLARSLFRFVNSARIGFGVRNIKTWTDFKGFDPETRLGGGTDNFTSGVFFTQPAPRTFFLKVTTTF